MLPKIWMRVAVASLALFAETRGAAAESNVPLVVDRGVFRADAVRFSADGRYAFFHSGTQYALWDTRNRATIIAFPAPPASTLLAVSDDAKYAALREFNRAAPSVGVWNIRLGTRVAQLDTVTWDARVAFSRDSELLAIADGDSVRILNARTATDVRKIGSTCRTERVQEALTKLGYHSGAQDGTFGPLTAAAVEAFQRDHRMTPDGRLSAAVCSELGLSPMAHGSAISHLAFTPDGGSLVTVAPRDSTEYGYGSSVVVWHWLDGTIINRFGTFDDTPGSIVVSGDGCELFIGGSGVRVFALDGGQEIARYEPENSSAGTENVVDVSPDGSRAVIVDARNGTVVLWEWEKNLVVRHIDTVGSIFDAGFARLDGGVLIISSNQGLYTYDVVAGELAPASENSDLRILDAIEFSPDGRYLAVSTWGGAYVWDLTTGNVHATDKLVGAGTLWNTFWGGSLYLFPSIRIDENNILIGLNTKGAVAHWSLATGNLEGKFSVEPPAKQEQSIDLGGATLALTTSTPGVTLRHAESGTVLGSIASDVKATAVALTSDGQVIAVGGEDGTLRLIDRRASEDTVSLSAECTEILCANRPPGKIEKLRFSRSGNLLVSSHSDRSPQVWSVPGRRRIHTFAYHADPSNTQDTMGIYYSITGTAAFSPDDTHIAVGYGNGVVTMSQIDSGSEEFRKSFPSTSIWNVAWSPDGRYVAATTSDFVLHVWDAATGADVATLRVFEGDDWLLVSADGRYNGSRKALRALRIVSDGLYRRLDDEVRNARTPAAFRLAPLSTLAGKGPTGITGPAPAPPQQLGAYRRKYAVIVGVAKYERLRDRAPRGELTNLKYADRDAREFEAFLKDARLSGGGWEVTTLLNKDATTRAVDDALTTVLTKAEPDDFVMIFFSGHGRAHPIRQQDVYLLTYDFEPEESRSGYSYTVLQQMIAETKAQHVVAFIDACRSGEIGFADKAGSAAGPFSQDVFERLQAQSPPNRLIFSSGRDTQGSNEDEEAHLGVFTEFLLLGLKGEAPDRKNPRFVDLGELRDYVKDAVVNYCRRTKKPMQVPELWEKHGLTYEDFPLALRR